MEYVCTGATLKCTMGTSCPKLKATPKNVSLTGKDQANIADYVSMKNIPSFGRCRSLAYPPTASATAAAHGKLTPMPCIPGTCPKWKAIDKDSLICGEPALLEPSTLKCVFGGTISIVNPGQTLEIKVRPVLQLSEQDKQEIPEDLLQEFNELDKEGLDTDSVLDGIQLALDAAGMVPVLGAIPDLINASISALRGDWVGAGLSVLAAVPLVGDVAGGAKLAYKGAKIAKAANKGKNIEKVAAQTSKAKNSNKINKSFSNSQVKQKTLDKDLKRIDEIKQITKKYIDKDISPDELKSTGICKNDEEVKIFNAALKQERKEEAYKFFKKYGGKDGLGESDDEKISGLIKGMDLNKPIIIKEIPPDGETMKLYRYIRRNPDGSVTHGKFFIDDPKIIPNEIGISDTYGKTTILDQHDVYHVDFKNKKLNEKVSSKIVEEELYEVEILEYTIKPTEKVKCIQSTAAPIMAPKNANWSDTAPENLIQTSGGETQYYLSMDKELSRNISKTAKQVKKRQKKTIFEKPTPKETTIRTIEERVNYQKDVDIP